MIISSSTDDNDENVAIEIALHAIDMPTLMTTTSLKWKHMIKKMKSSYAVTHRQI